MLYESVNEKIMYILETSYPRNFGLHKKEHICFLRYICNLCLLASFSPISLNVTKFTDNNSSTTSKS